MFSSSSAYLSASWFIVVLNVYHNIVTSAILREHCTSASSQKLTWACLTGSVEKKSMRKDRALLLVRMERKLTTGSDTLPCSADSCEYTVCVTACIMTMVMLTLSSECWSWELEWAWHSLRTKFKLPNCSKCSSAETHSTAFGVLGTAKTTIVWQKLREFDNVQ